MDKSRLKILVVAESIDVNSGSGSKANMALIENLAKIGFVLKVYHYSRKAIKTSGYENFSIPENRFNYLFFLSRLERYFRKFLKISLNPKIEKNTGFSFTLKNDRNSIVSALKKEKNFDPDWVLTLSQGGSFRPHHALLRIPDWHSKWIAYIHDPYPMHWYPKPYTWKEPGYKFKQNFMQRMADHCRYIAYPSLLLKEWMGSHYNVFSEKGIVIPHQLNESFNIRKPDFISFDSSEFNILHAGNFLQARKPHGLIEGFLRFVDKFPASKARLIHVGPALHYSSFLEKKAAECENISVFCENKSFEEVSWLQQHASVNIIIEAKAEFSPFLPGKFPHCIATEKPILILGPPKSEVRRLLGEDYPFYAEIDDPESIAIYFEKLYKAWLGNDTLMDYKGIKQYLSADNLKNIIEGL